MITASGPLLRTALAVLVPVLVLAVPRSALAAECATDDDCEHGFACDGVMSGSGGASSGGASGTAGTAGMIATGGTTSGTAGFVPRTPLCGDAICEGTEASTCPTDCVESLYCVLAECGTDDDCAEGYQCAAEPIGGTGGANGAVCGDGLCTSGESEASCAEDCTATRRCAVTFQLCTSDANCAPGFYCRYTVSGAGGTSASGSTGAGGFSSGGTLGGSAGTGESGASGSGGTTGGTGAGDAAVAGGMCRPLEEEGGGSGGASVGGASAGGTAGVGTGGITGGTGGVGGTGEGGSGAHLPMGGTTSVGGSQSTGGSSGTDNGGTSSGGSSNGATGGGGGQGGSSTGTGSGGTAPSGDEDPGSAERGGCSVSREGRTAPFAAFGVLGLVLARLVRRRRTA